MRAFALGAVAALAFSATASATVFSFTTDPFAGSAALTTPGRQVVGGEPFISFNPATDSFAFNPAIFGVATLSFVNDIAGNLPPSGVNFVVLESFDDDANPATAFGAGNAANLIADRITATTPGFFVYFNSGLNTPRLVFSTDLSDNTADLKILARMTNLVGQSDQLALFGAANVALVPEPSGALVLATLGAFAAWGPLRRRVSRRP